MNEKEFLLFCLRTLKENFTGKVFIVGGFVREKLLGNETFDFDFIVESNSLEITQKIAKKTKGVFVLLDQERQTGRIAWNKSFSPCEMDFDITTLVGKSIEEDLQSRDLTINALAIELKDDWEKFFDSNYQIKKEDIIDFSNGYDDFINKELKTFKPSNLTDDPLRMLRVFRFSAKLGFKISDKTLNNIIKNSELIKKPAKERILKELFSIFASNKTHEIINIMSKTKLIDYLFEDISIFKKESFDKLTSNLSYFENLDLNNKEIYNYLNECLTLNHNRKTLIKIVIFLLYLRNNLSNNEYLSKVESFLKKNHFSSNECKFILKNLHLVINENIDSISLDRKSLYFFFKNRVNETISSLLIELCLKENFINEKEYNLLDIYLKDKILSNQPKIITGNDLIKELNLKSGKHLGELLEQVNIAQAEKLISNYYEALEFVKKLIS